MSKPIRYSSKINRAARDTLFEDKLALLELYYPKFLKASLSDILESCASDIDAVRDLLSGAAPKKRVALTQGSLGTPKTRKLLTQCTESTESNSSTEKLTPKPFVKAARSAFTTTPRTKVILNTPEDVERYLAPYASLHLNFLPAETCDSLLSDLMDGKSTFKYNLFYLFGNRCELSHLVGLFARPDTAYTRLVYNGLKSSAPAPYTPSMEEACCRLEEFINKEVIPNESKPLWNIQSVEPTPSNENNDVELSSSEFKGSNIVKSKWTSDICLVNCYEKLSNNLAWHSDRLSHIGPLNHIASLSLGSTRVFRLRNIHNRNMPMFHILLPHNSVLLMRPGCQEEFQHCVSSMNKAIALHESVGSLRFGITCRHYPPFFIDNLPKCRCDIGMILRRSYKNIAIRGQYFWSCENVYQNKDCGDFHWADFTNVSGRYIAKDKNSISTWIAPEDYEKHEYDQKHKF